MQHTYNLSGLSCLGCKTSVESALNEVKGVKEAIVDMATGMVTIDMDSHIELKTFQDVLKKTGSKYSIEMPGEHSHQHSDKIEKPANKGKGIYYCSMHCEC